MIGFVIFLVFLLRRLPQRQDAVWPVLSPLTWPDTTGDEQWVHFDLIWQVKRKPTFFFSLFALHDPVEEI